ncbi:hypothetical protein [Microtetraspora sp. NBRC 16547]|uniref:hypothetical protein n=1 Tax=Microtetraspora sp. NBRC 16547 TaxID=3030993 RepID=UPI0024A2E613|nr:hypothetical protein [Microtetraspora sp. NBRC 16547]GLW99888.1 hypothetical protein Misp02_39750 [Microtetraspora sp. NBRC 16547]
MRNRVRVRNADVKTGLRGFCPVFGLTGSAGRDLSSKGGVLAGTAYRLLLA